MDVCIDDVIDIKEDDTPLPPNQSRSSFKNTIPDN